MTIKKFLRNGCSTTDDKLSIILYIIRGNVRSFSLPSVCVRRSIQLRVYAYQTAFSALESHNLNLIFSVCDISHDKNTGTVTKSRTARNGVNINKH